MTLYPVIMAGGSGTRFWPLSRAARPKQFLPLASSKPLITETVNRLAGLARPKDIFVVCGKTHAAAVRKLTRIPAGNVIIEPMARNTAPALALATAHVAARDPRGVIAALPADHHISDPAGFRKALAEAARGAEQGYIVTLGLTPTRPDTGFGYIRAGDLLDGPLRRVQAFVEKPDPETAQRYLDSGEYLWNGGIFVFRADVMLQEFAAQMPDLSKELDAIRAALGTPRYPAALAKRFKAMPATSIDYGVAEKSTRMAVLPGSFGWSDVGSFAALPEVRPADEHGNVVSGKGAVVIDCRECVIVASDRPLAVVGLKGMVVVDSGDAVLVLPKERSQDVRKVVEMLKERKASRFL